ncbi:37368_t:CDS:2 [Gigaspora margarita]|uniref:37368_t:CDS:1 n=1 Tax=Gigaspora margarita TaxID=4874 RepID=A0ABN7WID9_GIGMA|nr:37368_t:CDS:2 [Gigaspora margarita]
MKNIIIIDSDNENEIINLVSESEDEDSATPDTTLNCVLINPSYEEWKNGANLKEYQDSKINKNIQTYNNSNTASNKIKNILLISSKCQTPMISIESSASTSQKRIGGRNDDISKRIKLDVPQFLWPDVYPPNDLAELALEGRRLKEVEKWFDNAFSKSNHGKMQSYRLLVLSGPPGSSKTSVIKLIAKKRNLHVIEWENPQTFTTDHPDEFVPVMAPFELFLSYNGRNPHKKCILNQNDSQIIIVEDLPCLVNAEAKKKFHQAIRAHIKHPRTYFPLVIIISEAHSIEDFDEYVGKDSLQILNLHSILPNDIISSDQCTTLEFLPINNTQMGRCLKLFIDKVYINNCNKKEIAMQLCPLLVKQCYGDIRLAINALQFLMVETPKDAPEKFTKNYGARTTSHKKLAKGSQEIRKRKMTNSIRMPELKTILDPTLLDSVTCNELITVPFKAIGRVLYNKRTEDSNDETHKGIQQKINLLQGKLVHPREINERMPLTYTPESTLDNMCIEYHIYMRMLQHYYPHFYGNILECQFASECLSDAELLMNNQDFRVGIKLTPTAVILATRGLFFAHIQHRDKKKPLLNDLPSLKDFREHISNKRLKNEDKFVQYFQEDPMRRLTRNDTWKIEIAPFMGKMVHGLRMGNPQKQFLKEIVTYDVDKN